MSRTDQTKFLIKDIRLPLDVTDEAAVSHIRNHYGLNGEILIHKKSLDARKKEDIHFVYTFLAEEKAISKKLKKKAVPYSVQEPTPQFGTATAEHSPVIVGAGPAGLFCAYLLSLYGYRPIVIERGEPIEKRTETVNRFFTTGILNTDSNVQFGEGGAGAFSDGKLTTRTNDPLGQKVTQVLSRFSELPELSYQAKPHIGTDRLAICVKNLREEIKRLGGTFLFSKTVTDFHIKNGKIESLTLNGSEEIGASQVVFATGHSAKDIYRLFYEKGITMAPKSFSVGARIEHHRSVIDEIQYGKFQNHPNLGAADYQLFHHCQNGHTAYSFCMCPGGVVVPSQSEEETIVVNGMSHLKRDGKNSNSAICVSVSGEDFGTGLFDGLRFLERLEKKAYSLAGCNNRAPFTTSQILTGVTPSEHYPEPTYALGVTETDFGELFPDFVTEAMREGLFSFEKKMKGFLSKGAIFTGIETRTSSPLRIVRNEALQSLEVSGLYPCGEGAGYAGGIVSAGVDGMRVAFKIMEQFAPIKE